jgi:hypothetical protein
MLVTARKYRKRVGGASSDAANLQRREALREYLPRDDTSEKLIGRWGFGRNRRQCAGRVKSETSFDCRNIGSDEVMGTSWYVWLPLGPMGAF